MCAPTAIFDVFLCTHTHTHIFVHIYITLHVFKLTIFYRMVISSCLPCVLVVFIRWPTTACVWCMCVCDCVFFIVQRWPQIPHIFYHYTGGCSLRRKCLGLLCGTNARDLHKLDGNFSSFLHSFFAAACYII